MQHCRKCPDAVAKIRGGVEVPKLSGCIRFYQQKGCVLIVAEILDCPGKLRQDSSAFTSIREKTAPERTFQEQEVITIPWIRYIQNTLVTYHR